VSTVERKTGIRRGLAVAAVFAGLVAGVAILLMLLVPPAVRQGRNLGADLPEVIQDLGDLPLIGDRLVENDVPAKVDEAIRRLPERLAGDTTPLEQAGRSAVDGLVAAGITLLLAVSLLLDGGRLLRAARRLLPADERDRADRFGSVVKQVVGRYVGGSVTVAALAGTVNLIAGLALGVPLAVLAALNVMLWNLIPQVGGLFGGVPFVLLGLTKGPTTGLACLVIFIVYMNIENHLVQPLLVGSAVKLSPPATMCAALLGVAAGGVVGAVLVIPFVGAAKALYLEIRGTSLPTDAPVGRRGEKNRRWRRRAEPAPSPET
jgi:predicted PurR-regulated permease PerM